MKVCVLLPDYTTSNVDYQHYDPPRDLTHLLPEHTVHTVFLNKLTTYKQLKKLSNYNYDIFINLCEGYLEWEVPSIDVIYTLELLNLPFTGPTTTLYDPTKELMKYVAYCCNVATPNFTVITATTNLQTNIKHLQFPLFVKPAKAGDSLGVDENSLVNNEKMLQAKVNSLLNEFDEILIEEYVDGREFTVLVAANADGKTCTSYNSVEYIFPKNKSFKTYALKTSELHTNANVVVQNKQLNERLKASAEKIFLAFNGVGYARLDFRLDNKNELYFLEINFTCSVFYNDGYEGSADYILKLNGIGQQNFLQHIIAEGIQRHNKKQRNFVVKGNSIAGYGIYANKFIANGEIIFKGEEKGQRIVTKKFVDANWNDVEKENFKRYAYPISQEVYILWSNNAADWAPQNHSCNPNTAYKGLNVVAIKDILPNEELTLDYANFLNENSEPFDCQCGYDKCRGKITGTLGNIIS